MRLKKKKKGAAIIEYLVVLPAFMILLWTISQIMLFTLASSTFHESAMEGARVLAMETRGYDGKLDDLSNASEVEAKMHEKISTVAQFNRFILLYNEEDGTQVPLTSGGGTCQDEVCTFIEQETACTNALEDSDKKRVVCAFTQDSNVNGRDHQQVIVKLKANFRVVGNFVPGIKDKAFLHASGVSTKELTGRFQHYYSN